MVNFISIWLLLILPYRLIADYCYSISTQVDNKTPISPLYQLKNSRRDSINARNKIYLFSDNRAFFGCYKDIKIAKKVMRHSNFSFKKPKIVYHNLFTTTPYIISSKNSNLDPKKSRKNIQKIYKKYTKKNISKIYPKSFFGDGIKIIDFDKITFLPLANLYSLHKIYQAAGIKDKILVLYDGIYNLAMLCNTLNNSSYIKKREDNTYEIKIPIFISPTASLAIRNKNVYLQTEPKPILIIYYGKLYIENSKFYAWNTQKNCYAKRENIENSKLLYLDHEKSRPYFTGLSGSQTYIINTLFRGLGFRSSVSTFGLSLLYFPDNQIYTKKQSAFKYFMSKSGRPKGIYIGNEVFDFTIGFFANGAVDTYYLGNYLHDNIIYNFDSHNYSNNIVIARNLVSKAKHSHGIIISKGVKNSIIAQNISLKNHSSGIMIDRDSNHNTIFDNLAIENGYMGLSVQESRNILISNNRILLNGLDGIMVRNSLKVSIKNNNISYNTKNGIEVLSKKLGDTSRRDLLKDPYHKASSAVVENNYLNNNYSANINVKNSSSIFIKENSNLGISKFGGDLNFFYRDILRNNGDFFLYGRGFPYHPMSKDTKKMSWLGFKSARDIYKDLINRGNLSMEIDLGVMYLENGMDDEASKEFKVAASNLVDGALAYLGYMELKVAREDKYMDKIKTLEGLTLIIENFILQKTSFTDIEKLVYFIPNGALLIEKAFQVATKRMLRRNIFSKQFCANLSLCKITLQKRQEIKSAIKIFLYKINLLNNKSFLNYCNVTNRNFTIFTKFGLTALQNRFKKHNINREIMNNNNRQNTKKCLKNLSCKKHIQKQAYNIEQVGELLESISRQEIKNLIPFMRKKLDDINSFRSDKISMKKLLEILKQKKESRAYDY